MTGGRVRSGRRAIQMTLGPTARAQGCGTGNVASRRGPGVCAAERNEVSAEAQGHHRELFDTGVLMIDALVLLSNCTLARSRVFVERPAGHRQNASSRRIAKIPTSGPERGRRTPS